MGRDICVEIFYVEWKCGHLGRQKRSRLLRSNSLVDIRVVVFFTSNRSEKMLALQWKALITRTILTPNITFTDTLRKQAKHAFVKRYENLLVGKNTTTVYTILGSCHTSTLFRYND